MVSNDRLSNATSRGIDEPAPTITAGHDPGNGVWVPGIRFGNQENSAVRRLDEPAATLRYSERMNACDWIPVAANEGTTAEDMEWTGARPSPTIVGTFAPDVVAAPGWRKAGDGPRQSQKGSVRVTVTEAAILQSFRADYPWQGSKTSQYQQVGNAIPVKLAAAVLRAAMG